MYNPFLAVKLFFASLHNMWKIVSYVFIGVGITSCVLIIIACLRTGSRAVESQASTLVPHSVISVDNQARHHSSNHSVCEVETSDSTYNKNSELQELYV